MLVLIAPLLKTDFCIAMPKAQRIDLPNHLRVLVFEEHSIPAVTLQLLVGGGSWRDPPDRRPR